MHMHIGTWSSLHDLAKMVRGAVLAVYTLYVVYTNPTSSYVIMDGYYNLYYAVSILYWHCYFILTIVILLCNNFLQTCMVMHFMHFIQVQVIIHIILII